MPIATWYPADGDVIQRSMGTPKRVADLNAWLKFTRKLIPTVPQLLVTSVSQEVSLERIEITWHEGKLVIQRKRQGVAG